MFTVFREDAYMHHSYTVTDITFEIASILYNIGALHSILGSMDSRTSAEVLMKISLEPFFCFLGSGQLIINIMLANCVCISL
jgi:hypothetical protein